MYAKIPDLSTGGSGVTLGPDYYISVLVVQEPSLAPAPISLPAYCCATCDCAICACKMDNE